MAELTHIPRWDNAILSVGSLWVFRVWPKFVPVIVYRIALSSCTDWLAAKFREQDYKRINPNMDTSYLVGWQLCPRENRKHYQSNDSRCSWPAKYCNILWPCVFKNTLAKSNIARHGRLLLCTFCLTGTDTAWQIMTDNKWTRQNVWTRGLTRSELRVQDWRGGWCGVFLVWADCQE